PRGLRATQFTLLSALHLAGSKPIGELAEMLSADRTTLTRNLSVAEKNGWVALRVDPADARSRLATITRKGSRTLAAALPIWDATQQRLLQDIGEPAAASLHRLAGGPCVMPLPAQSG
ncbi:MAG TPA: MarR family winged helix-turn-helix transcriptional regulator, partial [Rhodanobacter sp.]|nr:MarR family winged helix-turn-helix transcriptional regulator [Rhodanobacter sp.]